MARNTGNQQGGNGMIMGGGGNGGLAYVDAEALKQVDVPVQALLGTANGAVAGLGLSAIGSAIFTVGQQEGRINISSIFRNMTNIRIHLGAILAGTAAVAALGGIIRWSTAAKHNEWSDRHYAFLEKQMADTHVEREDSRENAKTTDQGAKR